MNYAQAFDNAADYLEEYGWTQRRYGEHEGPCCVEGALTFANKLENSVFSVVNSSSIQLWDRFGERIGCIGARVDPDMDYVTLWNDSDDRTKEEVIAALRKAAEEERANSQERNTTCQFS